jgi:hypothetical protein
MNVVFSAEFFAAGPRQLVGMRFMSSVEKCWISDADSSPFFQLSLPEDAIPRKRMGIRCVERVPKNV